jgi:hypothetical protein
VQLVRDLLDQSLLDRDGEAAGRVDDLLLSVEGRDVFVDRILCGGGILVDDLGPVGRAWEATARIVRRRSLRRAGFAWALVSELAEHAVTIAVPRTAVSWEEPARGLRLRVIRRLPARSADGIALRVVDVRVADPLPRERPRVLGLVVRRRHRTAWQASLRPRQLGAPPGWRFVPVGDVRFTDAGLAVERAYDDLPAAPNAVVSPPPVRVPRAAG